MSSLYSPISCNPGLLTFYSPKYMKPPSTQRTLSRPTCKADTQYKATGFQLVKQRLENWGLHLGIMWAEVIEIDGCASETKWSCFVWNYVRFPTVIKRSRKRLNNVRKQWRRKRMDENHGNRRTGDEKKKRKRWRKRWKRVRICFVSSKKTFPPVLMSMHQEKKAKEALNVSEKN